MSDFDKYKTCKDCHDRVMGCHATCEGYIARRQEREETLRKEKENRWRPTEHQTQAVIDYYKRQKKNYKYYRGKKK